MVMPLKQPVLRIPAIVMTSVAATYLVMVILQADHFLRAVLRGHYWRYQELFIPAFVIFASVGLWAFRNVGKTFSKVVIAVCASYAAGLFAFFFLPSRMPAAELLSLHGIDGAFFSSPLICLCWVYGGGAILTFWVLSRRDISIAR